MLSFNQGGAMFTGIVQGIGKVVAVAEKGEHFRRHWVALPDSMANHLQIGASIANNGCCLTISEIDEQQSVVAFDLMKETLDKTNLGQLQQGSRVNLERAVRVGDEIGGHLMSGHIMCQTTILDIETTEQNKTIWLVMPSAIRAYVLHKGFIGLDGCSLTIGEVHEDKFCVHLIPETLEKTLFGERQVGDSINVEVDPQTQAIVDTVQRVLQTASATQK